MAKYSGAARRLYNFQRRIRSRIEKFQKAGVELPAELDPQSGRVGRILSVTPSKVTPGIVRDIAIVEGQIARRPKAFTVAGVLEERRQVLERLRAPVEEGGLGYAYITEENKSIFFDFMDYVRDKFEGMKYDSDIYAAAANEMLGQAQRRKISASDLKANFERFASQALRITTSNRTLMNYQQNFNRLARRLGL